MRIKFHSEDTQRPHSIFSITLYGEANAYSGALAVFGSRWTKYRFGY